MHFASFVINLLAWAFIGIALGFSLHKGTKRGKVLSVFVGSMFSLLGGVFSSMTHGMFPEIGIDFFNLIAAFAVSIVSLYLFAPNTRASIVSAGTEVYSRTKNFISGSPIQKSPYFNSTFWKNIRSSISR